ncbi:IS110 family transposase [Cryobacterium luteum]|uniref:IS110 family transposase n=1 Tax=Cryobacterium luteum TaxID=1424661 RepID=UPI0008BE420D|nr:IS110 family transposase [Cryobacterium luteum]SEO12151.1 Transposase [Cryobacterium luteum]
MTVAILEPPHITVAVASPNTIFAGVDTHKDTHHVAIVDGLGRPIADREFLAVGSGYRQIIDFLHAHGIVEAVGVEGTGSYGAELARVLAGAGMRVLEVCRANRAERRLRGKSDPLDARQAALSVVAGRGLATPKQRDGDVESMRILLAERSSATKARTASINQIHSLLVSAPEAVRQDFRRFDGDKLTNTLARTRPAPGTTPELVVRASAKRLAQRHQALTADIAYIDQQLTVLAVRQNPALMAASGVGPFVAAHLLATAGDNPDRITTKAQFAALCGVAPIPASSGTRQRFRLSRGGDRQANAALHRIVLLRKRHKEPRTMAYIARRTAEGLSDRDIVRCLKRHVANEIFALLTQNHAVPLPSGPWLRQRRQTLGIVLTDAAKQLNVPYQRLRRLEIGQRADIDLETAFSAWLDGKAQHPNTAQRVA